MIVLQVKRTNSKLIKQLAEFEARGEFEKSKVESEGSEVQHMQGNIQALLKIIISQRETIQSQLGTLKVLEDQKEKWKFVSLSIGHVLYLATSSLCV